MDSDFDRAPLTPARSLRTPCACCTPYRRMIPRMVFILVVFVFQIVGSTWIGCTSAPQLRDGQLLEDKGRLEEAHQFYQKALTDGRVSEAEARPALQRVGKRLAQDRVESGRQALSEGRLDTALQLAMDAWRMAPDSPTVLEFSREAVGKSISKAGIQLREGNPLEAVELLLRLKEGWPESQAILESVERESSRARQVLTSRIDAYDQRGMQANAYLAALALERLFPADAAAAENSGLRRQKFLRQYLVPLTVSSSSSGLQGILFQGGMPTFPLRSPLLIPQAGQAVANGLHLDLSDPAESFSQLAEPDTGSVVIAAGLTRVVNPELQEARERLNRLEEGIMRLGERMDELADQINRAKSMSEKAAFSADLARIEKEHHQQSLFYATEQERMNAIPKELDVPGQQEIRYPIELYRRQATLTVRMQATSSRSDLPLKVDMPISTSAETSCQVHPAYPQYQIAARSLKFTVADSVLRREAYGNLVKEVGATVDRLMNDVLILERKQATYREKEGKYEEALESWMRLLISQPGKPGDEVRAALKARGVRDADALLAQLRPDAQGSR